MKLTGKLRYRTTWRGKLVLQVQYLTKWDVDIPATLQTPRWRDAKVGDLNEICWKVET